MTEIHDSTVNRIAIIGPAQKTVRTPERAAEMPCPLGRLFTTPHETCIADQCPLWRWRQLVSTDPRFTSAVQRYIAAKKALPEYKDVQPALLHKEAVEMVTADPIEHHLPEGPEVGFCGLGGAVQ